MAKKKEPTAAEMAEALAEDFKAEGFGLIRQGDDLSDYETDGFGFTIVSDDGGRTYETYHWRLFDQKHARPWFTYQSLVADWSCNAASDEKMIYFVGFVSADLKVEQVKMFHSPDVTSDDIPSLPKVKKALGIGSGLWSPQPFGRGVLEGTIGADDDDEAEEAEAEAKGEGEKPKPKAKPRRRAARAGSDEPTKPSSSTKPRKAAVKKTAAKAS